MAPSEKVPSRVADYERLAEEFLKRDALNSNTWDYIHLAEGDRQTYDESKAAFKRYYFQPRILTARPCQSLCTTILGHPISMPVCVAPTVGHFTLHPDGAAAAARATVRAGTAFVLSSITDLATEDFATAVPENGHYWAQTYLFKDRRNTLNIVRNAEKYGFKAIAVTVDSPTERRSAFLGDNLKKYAALINRPPVPNLKYLNGKERDFTKTSSHIDVWTGAPTFASGETFCYANWEDLAWLKEQTKLPIVLKGILTAKAARQAATFGASGIIVSAHGGRNLDGVPAPIHVLAEIVDAVKETRMEVYMDGGVRTGNDVLKALALGARAVFIGRPVLYGLAINGEDGVFDVLKILKEELQLSMALNGCSTISDIDRSIVRHESQFPSKL